mmetsp:Transcript_128728/g.305438  ORF Transcript_128728/g.305438 Transcript_128728/m.305438 type:complete len:137 (+) Transcript_128728:538-948(+)
MWMVITPLITITSAHTVPTQPISRRRLSIHTIPTTLSRRSGPVMVTTTTTTTVTTLFILALTRHRMTSMSYLMKVLPFLPAIPLCSLTLDIILLENPTLSLDMDIRPSLVTAGKLHQRKWRMCPRILKPSRQVSPR